MSNIKKSILFRLVELHNRMIQYCKDRALQTDRYSIKGVSLTMIAQYVNDARTLPDAKLSPHIAHELNSLHHYLKEKESGPEDETENEY